MVLVIGIALVAALIARHTRSRSDLRTLALVGGVAFGLRLLAVFLVNLTALRAHDTGVWLYDEASFFLATESLMPWPWDKPLPQGLEHLGGDGYLGLLTAISVLLGHVQALAFRFANAGVGTIVALICAWLGAIFFGRTAGLAAGLAAAVWPDLVVWSAVFLRDTVGSLAVVGVWYALVSADRRRWQVNACFVLLSLILLQTLREYLALATAAGVAAWLAYPLIRRQRARTLVSAGCAIVAIGAVVGVLQTQRIDESMNQLFYRQTVTRMETLGRLYHDPPPPDAPAQIVQLPFRPGAAIAIPDPNTGWLLAGLVESSAEPGFVNVVLTDDTSRTVPISGLVLLQDARTPPLQLFSWVLPSAGSVFLGLPAANDAPKFQWIGSALAWDGLLAAGVFGLIRGKLGVRLWLYPLFVIIGTVAALSAIPGDPGNAERHRATQTVPLLLVFASGALASSRRRGIALAGRMVNSPTSMPASAITAVASPSRSEW